MASATKELVILISAGQTIISSVAAQRVFTLAAIKSVVP